MNVEWKNECVSVCDEIVKNRKVYLNLNAFEFFEYEITKLTQHMYLVRVFLIHKDGCRMSSICRHQTRVMASNVYIIL